MTAGRGCQALGSRQLNMSGVLPEQATSPPVQVHVDQGRRGATGSGPPFPTGLDRQAALVNGIDAGAVLSGADWK